MHVDMLWEVQDSKAAADAALKRQNYRDAWLMYSRALADLQQANKTYLQADEATHQLQRNILSNRCAAYTAAGRTHEALLDAEQLQQQWPSWSKSWFRGARACEAAKQYTVALHQYAQAWRLESSDGQLEVQRHMLRTVSHLTTPQLAGILLDMLLGKDSSASDTAHAPQHTEPLLIVAKAGGWDSSRQAPDSQKLGTQAADKLCSSKPQECMLQHVLVQAGITYAERQEAAYQLAKRLHGQGAANGFPAFHHRVVSWMCNGKPQAMEQALLTAQLFSQLQCWDAAAVYAHQAAREARLLLMSTPPPLSDAAVDQMACCYSVLGTALLKYTLQLYEKLDTAVLQVLSGKEKGSTTAMSWKLLYQHAVLCLAAAAQMCPGKTEYQAAMNSEHLHLLGGEVLWRLKRCASSAVLQLTSKQQAVQLQYESLDGSTPRPRAAAAIASGSVGVQGMPMQGKHIGKKVEQQAQEGSCRQVDAGGSIVGSDTACVQLLLSLVFPDAARGTLTGTTRTQVRAAIKAAVEAAVQLVLQGSDSTNTEAEEAGSMPSTGCASTNISCEEPAECEAQAAAGALALKQQCTVKVLLEGVKQPRGLGRCPLHVQLRAVIAVPSAGDANTEPSVHKQLLQTAVLGQIMQSDGLPWPQQLGAVTADATRCQLLPDELHVEPTLQGMPSPTSLLSLETSSQAVGTLLLQLRNAGRPYALAHAPEQPAGVLGTSTAAASRLPDAQELELHNDSMLDNTMVTTGAACAKVVTRECQPMSAAVTCGTSRRPILQLPYVGYQLVDVWGKAMERPTKHPFALSRVFYAAEELPTDEHQVWFQPSDGTVRWRQTASEVIILATKVPVGIPAKRLHVTIQPHKLDIRDTVTGVVYLSGTLERGVVCDECTWWCPSPSPTVQHMPLTSGTTSCHDSSLARDIASCHDSSLAKDTATCHDSSPAKDTATCNDSSLAKDTASCLAHSRGDDWTGVPQAGAEYGAGCVLVLSKMNLELLRGGQPAACWWPRLMKHHAEVAWDDAHKDYSDLPQPLKDAHSASEARAAQDGYADTASLPNQLDALHSMPS